jgi:hypothetical protein
MEEITADFIGAGLCKELGENEAQEMVISASAVMSLLMCDMVEKFYSKLTGTSWEYKTHPPSDLRLNIMQTLSDWGTDPYLGVSLRQFSDYILARV